MIPATEPAIATAVRRRLMAVLVPLTAMFVGACNQPPAVNPWRDDSISPDNWTTPSRQGFVDAATEVTLRHRGFAPSTVAAVNPDVPHYPLWWEDPFVDKGDMNNQFAWTWQDYLHMPYGLGRFILNTIGMPVSVVVHPPGMPMVSDGHVGRDHDAKPGSSPNPTATSADFDPSDAPSEQAEQPQSGGT